MNNSSEQYWKFTDLEVTNTSVTKIEDIESPSFFYNSDESEKLLAKSLSSSHSGNLFELDRATSLEVTSAILEAEAEKILNELCTVHPYNMAIQSQTIVDLDEQNDNLLGNTKARMTWQEIEDEFKNIHVIETGSCEPLNGSFTLLEYLANGPFLKSGNFFNGKFSEDIGENNKLPSNADGTVVKEDAFSIANKTFVPEATKGDELLNLPQPLNATYEKKKPCLIKESTFVLIEQDPCDMNEEDRYCILDSETPHNKALNTETTSIFNKTFDCLPSSQVHKTNQDLSRTIELVGDGVFILEGKCTTLMDMEANELSVVLTSKREEEELNSSHSVHMGPINHETASTATHKEKNVKCQAEIKESFTNNTKKGIEKKIFVLDKLMNAPHKGSLTQEEALCHLRKKHRATATGNGPLKAVPLQIANQSPQETPQSINDALLTRATSTPDAARLKRKVAPTESCDSNEGDRGPKEPFSLSFGSVSSIETEGANSLEAGLGLSTPGAVRFHSKAQGPQITSTPVLTHAKLGFCCDALGTPIVASGVKDELKDLGKTNLQKLDDARYQCFSGESSGADGDNLKSKSTTPASNEFSPSVKESLEKQLCKAERNGAFMSAVPRRSEDSLSRSEVAKDACQVKDETNCVTIPLGHQVIVPHPNDKERIDGDNTPNERSQVSVSVKNCNESKTLKIATPVSQTTKRQTIGSLRSRLLKGRGGALPSSNQNIVNPSKKSFGNKSTPLLENNPTLNSVGTGSHFQRKNLSKRENTAIPKVTQPKISTNRAPMKPVGRGNNPSLARIPGPHTALTSKILSQKMPFSKEIINKHASLEPKRGRGTMTLTGKENAVPPMGGPRKLPLLSTVSKALRTGIPVRYKVPK